MWSIIALDRQIHAQNGRVALVLSAVADTIRAYNCETAFLPLLARYVRFYPTALILYRRGKNTGLKRLFEAHGAPRPKYHDNVLPLCKSAAAVFAFGVIVFFRACLHAASARFIFILLRVFCFFSLFRSLVFILFFPLFILYFSFLFLSFPWLLFPPYF